MRKGFTIIEVTVVMTLTALSFMMCYCLMSQADNAHGMSRGHAKDVAGVQTLWLSIQTDALAKTDDWVVTEEEGKLECTGVTYEFKDEGVLRNGKKVSGLVATVEKDDTEILIKYGNEEMVFKCERDM